MQLSALLVQGFRLCLGGKISKIYFYTYLGHLNIFICRKKNKNDFFKRKKSIEAKRLVVTNEVFTFHRNIEVLRIFTGFSNV